MTMTSMIDERWRDIRIGNSRRTIGEHGSLLCCISEMLAQAGNPMNPASLNRWLAENGGYSSRGDLIFDAIQPLGIQRRPHTGDGQLNSTVAAIGIALRRGLGVLIAVRRVPWRASEWIWLRVLMVSGADFSIHDPSLSPAENYPVLLLPRYARPEQTLSDIIRDAQYWRVGLEQLGL